MPTSNGMVSMFKALTISTDCLNGSAVFPLTCAKFAPEVDEGYANPEFETDWHDRILDLGISALGRGYQRAYDQFGPGEIFGARKGLGVEQQGHNLGHMKQPDNPIWVKIRQYNSRMLVKLMEQLESVPEGGSMMDNTLIVYTSNNADYQHTSGKNWPVMLLGNYDGAFKTGCFTQLDGKRPINALYTSILRASGVSATASTCPSNWPPSSIPQRVP